MEDRMYKRTHTDRRTEADRRKGYDIAAFEKVGYERRISERRFRGEKRDGWTRVGKWESVCVAVISTPFQISTRSA